MTKTITCFVTFFYFFFRESSTADVEFEYYGMLNGITESLLEWKDSNGTRFYDLYPQTTLLLPDYLMMDVLGNIQFELFLSFTDVAFYDLMSAFDEEMVFSENFTNPDFEEEYLKAADKYLFSGRFKQCLVKAILYSGESPYDEDTDSFDNFIDEVYDNFEFWNGFREAFQDIYNSCQEIVWTKGLQVATNNDLIEITTQYMR